MLDAISRYTSSYLSTLPSAKQIGKNLNRVALPIIALIGMSCATVANAGPGTYAGCWGTCMGICLMSTAGGFIPMCMVTCAEVCGPAAIIPSP